MYVARIRLVHDRRQALELLGYAAEPEPLSDCPHALTLWGPRFALIERAVASRKEAQ